MAASGAAFWLSAVCVFGTHKLFTLVPAIPSAASCLCCRVRSSCVVQVLSELQQALLFKVHEARQHLVDIPSNQHEQMTQQLQLIQQLLQTLAVAQQ